MATTAMGSAAADSAARSRSLVSCRSAVTRRRYSTSLVSSAMGAISELVVDEGEQFLGGRGAQLVPGAWRVRRAGPAREQRPQPVGDPVAFGGVHAGRVQPGQPVQL